jgi:hypothetical protein
MQNPVAVAASIRTGSWLRLNAAAGLLLFAALAVVHYDVVFQGRSLVLTNHHNPLDYRPLAQNYGDGFVPFETWTSRNLYPYANIRDAGGPWWQWEPDGEFLRQAMRTGEWPFWDPYVGAGAPAMANMTPGYFFPPYTLLVALGASVPLKNVYFLALLWSAGFFTYLFLRRHDLAFASALLGGVIVMMSGGLNQHIGTIGLQSGAMLPPALYVTRVFLDARTKGSMLVVSLSYASIALASFPPMLFWVFGITAAYALWAIAFEPEFGPLGRMEWAIRWSLATILAVGLVAFFYVPAFALRADAPYVIAFYDHAAVESLPGHKILQLLSPTLAGGVAIYLNPPVPTSTLPNMPYVGVVALALALLARPAANSRTRTLFYVSMSTGVLIMLKLFGLPPAQWVVSLPLFNQIHYAHYFGMAISFLVAFLAALGLDRVLRGTVSPFWALVAMVFPLVAAESLWWTVNQIDMLKAASDRDWIRDWRALNAAGTLVAVAIGFGVLRPGVRRWAAAAVVVIAAGEGVYNNTYPSPKSWNIFQHPIPYVQFLQREAGMTRVMPFSALNGNLNSAFGIFSIESLWGINPPRPYEMYRRYADPPLWLFLREATRIPPDLVLDRAAIGFLVIRDVFAPLITEAQARGYTLKFDDGYASIFQRPTLPRFFFSSEYEVHRAPTVLSRLATTPQRTILLERTPPFPSTPNAPNDPEVRVESYRRNGFVLTVDAPRPGLVYASESYFTGWTARINGVATTIMPANYAFRAVTVPAGRSRIEFSYWPPGLTAGLTASAISAALLALYFVLFDRRRKPAPIAQPS